MLQKAAKSKSRKERLESNGSTLFNMSASLNGRDSNLLNSNSTKGLVGQQRGKIIMAQAISANL
jgi:hypothetical protein